MKRSVVVIAGGIGSRFWPLSRKSKPKQFLSSFNGKSFLRLAVERGLRYLNGEGKLYIVTNKAYENLVRREAPEAEIIFERKSLGTAGAIALGMVRAAFDGADQMLVMPADHFVEDEERLIEKFYEAEEILNKTPTIIVFGHEPTFPHSGYGYIRKGAPIDDRKDVFFVRRFFEKPSIERAKQYVDSGEYLWNMGIFMWKLQTLAQGFEDELPEYYQAAKIAEKILREGGSWDQILDQFENLDPISIDIGLIERAKNICCLEMTGCGWSDIGSLNVWIDLVSKDQAERSFEHINLYSENVKVHASKGIVVTLGVNNLLVVVEKDTVLVCSLDKVQEVGKVPQILAERGLEEYI